MQRSVIAVAARQLRAGARAPVLNQRVACLSTGMGGTDFDRKRKAVEEQYFKNLNESQRKKYADKLHEKELRSLLDILPADHNLNADTLHNILEWKHKDVLV